MNEQGNAQQVMQVMQQKLGNLELTTHALLSVLQDKDIVDQEEVNEEAQKIVEEMQEQQAEMGDQMEDIEDKLGDDE